VVGTAIGHFFEIRLGMQCFGVLGPLEGNFSFFLGFAEEM
jgi:hypothetical protein